MAMSFTLTATVIEIAPQEGYTVVRYVLGSGTQNCYSGDVFNVQVTDSTDIEVGDVTNLTFNYPVT